MSVLTKDEIFAECELTSELVPLGKGEVRVSTISGPDYIKLWSDPKNQKETGEFVLKDGVKEPVTTVDTSRFNAALLTYAVTDLEGNRVFTDADLDKVSRFSSGPFLKIAEVARRLNGLNGDEVKNSEGSQSELPFSGSASISE
jgi:hypothetical protein